jgi:hypothetical protein
MNEYIYEQNYMFDLANFINQPVWGGAPGFASCFLSKGWKTWSYIPYKRIRKGEDPYIRRNKKTGEIIYTRRWHINELQKEIGWEFSDDGYLKYERRS